MLQVRLRAQARPEVLASLLGWGEQASLVRHQVLESCTGRRAICEEQNSILLLGLLRKNLVCVKASELVSRQLLPETQEIRKHQDLKSTPPKGRKSRPKALSPNLWRHRDLSPAQTLSFSLYQSPPSARY